MREAFKYPGDELEVFNHAIRWKRYWASLVAPYINGRVLEVGAGTGNNTLLLQSVCRGMFSSWTCLEPDPDLLEKCRRKIAGVEPAVKTDVIHGTLADLAEAPGYDTILYIDVLEHIVDDGAEVQAATKRLSVNGHIIALVPARAFLYTEFDRRIGHIRRYSLHALKRLTPENCMSVSSRYVDSVGMLASLANRVLLRQALPTTGQIRVWDRLLIPVSRLVDKVRFGQLGKSALVVWKKL